MTGKDFLDFFAAILSVAATFCLIALTIWIFNKRQGIFKNDISCKTLCDYALMALTSGIVIYWYLLVQHIPDRKSPSWETIIGFISCALLMGAGIMTYRCLKTYCWPLLKIVPKLKIKMKIAVCFTIIFIFGALCWLWIAVAKVLPEKIMPLLESI